MIRVIVAEDSPTARALIVEVLGNDPGIVVVGEATTGTQAVDMVLRLRPDLITMDIEMPEMDGLEAARKIMEMAPTPIVVVSASTDLRGADRSLDALAAGALFVIDKPRHPLAPRFDEWRSELVGAVNAMAHVKVVRRIPRRAKTPASGTLARARTVGGPLVRLVAIAASTGGPAVLHEILKALPAAFPVPVVIVQHIASGFSGALATWLDQGSRMRVKLGEDGEPLQAGTVYVAPDEMHLGVADGRVALDASPKVGSFRPSATHLFESSARSYGSGLAAVVLTGMGADGVEGLRRVRAAGGKVFAQDPESCVVFGMPGEAVRAGVVDAVLTPAEIANELIRVTRRG